jgi:hypothetical protein
LRGGGGYEHTKPGQRQQERKREPSQHACQIIIREKCLLVKEKWPIPLTHPAAFGIVPAFHGRSSAHPSLAHGPVRLVVVLVRD